MDISVPLCRGWVLSIKDEEKDWVSFKYECLPNICYWSGCLDHFDRDCDKWIESDGTLDISDKKNELWIWASAMQVRRKLVVVVPGFYEARKKGGSRLSTLVAKKVASPLREVRFNDNHKWKSLRRKSWINSMHPRIQS